MEIATAVKVAAAAVKNKENLGKVVVIIIAAFTAPFLLFCMIFMQIMSAFAPDGVLKSSQYVQAEETAVHRSLQVIMESYYENLYEELAEQRLKTIDKYTVEYEVPAIKEELEEEEKKNPEKPGKTETEELETEEPEKELVIIKPTVMRRMNYIPENLIIAYLLMKEGIDIETAAINEWMVWDFLDNIISIQETNAGENTYWIENKVLTMSQIADLYFPGENERSRFLITCEAYGEYFDVAQSKIIDGNGEETYIGATLENLSNVPLYLQYDATWGSVAYGNGTIKKNGCCPTCLAMVFSYFRGMAIYPNDIVAWSGDKYYVTGAGTSWEIFYPAARNWGVNCSNIGKNQTQMIQALQSGKLIVASMGPGTFTKGGHFIVLTGITENGKVKVNDPNDNNMKRHVEMEFEISLILRECKNMWVFG